MKKIAVGIVMVVAALSSPVFVSPLWAAGQAANAQGTATEDRGERDRRRATEREARDARENEKLIDEAQSEIDAFALDLLEARYNDPFLQEYVNELGQSLVPTETPAGILFSFRVIHDRVPNALALPDGRIFVTSGLLTFINSEAELAFTLGHEIGHVLERHYARGIREARSRARVGAIVGAGLGALVGGLTKGKEGAVAGSVVGAGTGALVAAVTINSYNRQQEDEADRRGVMLALDRRFDAKESEGLFKRLAATFGEQDKFTNAIWGRHSRNVERVENINRLLGSDLASRYNSLRSAGELSLGSGQMHLYTSAMIRDTAIDYMGDDRYDLSKALLEQISSYRARDPKTLWALGRVYKTVGRTASDRNKALDFLQQAVRLDQRNRYPYIRRDYGLMQARLGNTAGAVESIKSYILNQMELTSQYPPDIENMYDYLLTFGDSSWQAPKIDTRIVTASAPAPPAAPAAPAPVASTPAARGPQKSAVPTPARPAQGK